jgi:lipopolysaccharide export system protein LptC
MTLTERNSGSQPAHPRHHRLAMQARALRRRSYRVSGRLFAILKFLLPVLALLLLVLVAIWPQISEDRFRLPAINLEEEDELGLRMVRPRYLGVDRNNEPYAITADFANHRGANNRFVELESPRADLLGKNGTYVALKASFGRYDENMQRLELFGEVELLHDKGYRFVSTLAEVNLANGEAIGREPVEGYGPDAQISAQGFQILDRGQHIVFTGKSRLVLRSSGKGSSK